MVVDSVDMETDEVDVTTDEEEVFSVGPEVEVEVAEEDGLDVVKLLLVELDADSVGMLVLLVVVVKVPVDEDTVDRDELVVGFTIVETVVELSEGCCEVGTELVCEVSIVLFVAVIGVDVKVMVPEVVLLAEIVAEPVTDGVELELWTESVSSDVVALVLTADVVVADVTMSGDEDVVATLLVDVVSAVDVVTVLVSVLFEAVVCAASSAGSGVLLAWTLFAQSFA